MKGENYFDQKLMQISKVKNLFLNSDIRNQDGSDEYLSVLKDIGVVKYSERGESGNKTSDVPEKYKMVEKGDLVINPMNVTIGSSGVSNYSGCLSGVYLVLKPKKNIYSKYYHYVFHEKGFQKYLRTISYGIMEIRETLNKVEFFQLKIPNPTFYEQKSLAMFLDKETGKIESLIENINKKIELLKNQKISLLNEVLTKGLNNKNNMKPIGIETIGEIPAHWEINKMRFLGSFSNGLSKKSEYFGKGHPFYSYGDIYNNSALPSVPSGLVESTESERNKCSVKRGDVFFTRTSETTDDIGITSTCLETIDDSTFSGFVIRFRPKDDTLLPEYSKYFFQNHYKKTFIDSRMNIVTRASLSQSILGDVVIFYPPDHNEQKQIINFLDKKTKIFDELIMKEQKRSELLNELKSSLISEVIMGKRKIQ